MWIATTIQETRKQRQALAGSVAFVPTMGALHDGHAWLMRAGRQLADHVVVSIFVNPTQFGPNEDFARYPRTINDDLQLCEKAGVAGVFCPEVEEMYPPQDVGCRISLPGLDDILEGKIRPGHFTGVCRVVAKLLNIVGPDIACWGQKDYQQCRVVDAMMRDLAMPIRNVVLPTVREPDGLAMSSRNRYLDAENRRHATGLYKALGVAKAMVEQDGQTDPQIVEDAMRQAMEAHHFAVDYAVIRHPLTLTPLDSIEPRLTRGVVALAAGRLGPVRLIDNMILGRETAKQEE
ncbi:MAG: pantoate--beta-alanine ligase [Phycisphaeraceae bacterium]|nr:pantoate--beta-alanine ligase [Phycisphaeraceae bacterium]